MFFKGYNNDDIFSLMLDFKRYPLNHSLIIEDRDFRVFISKIVCKLPNTLTVHHSVQCKLYPADVTYPRKSVYSISITVYKHSNV